MVLAQAFWDAYRKRVKVNLTDWGERRRLYSWSPKVRTEEWTSMIKKTAMDACHDLEPLLGCILDVGGERINRLDVHATNARTGELVVAFESELGLWHRKGGWENEFAKLCNIDAKLRVLYCTFDVGEGRRYRGLLRERLWQTQPNFDHNRGEFLLIAGPAYNSEDPLQPWLAYSIDDGLELTPLSLDDPLLAVKFLYPSAATP